MGAAIEVIVRYQGREYVMTKGKVREVNLERHVEQAPWSADAWQRWELTGIETLTIVVER